ncbi:hypothetical protein [Tabrizicola sp.]|uniref:hypothetical protein n=1 Tax=Tabrizicola sp. TaxID=2005166 RepID=UPI003F40FD72
MRRAGDVVLLVLQRVLVLVGLYTILVALHLYAIETNWAGTKPKPLPGQDYYILPSWQRFVQGTATGAIAMGLGGMLFYLRRLYLAKRPQ